MRLPEGLYALLDDGLIPAERMGQVAQAAIDGGAPTLQLRLKRTSDALALPLIRAVVARAHAVKTVVIVNDRVDLALLGGADGVHLGEDDLPVSLARQLLGPGKLVGATTRTLADIERAQGEGADHVGLGPIFGTSTKTVNAPSLGVDLFGEIARASPLPVVGIAGVSLANIGSVARAGAHGAAVASDLLTDADVTARVRRLCAAFAARR